MQTNNKALQILIIEDNPGDYVLLKKYLQRTTISIKNFYWAKSLSEVANILKEQVVDIAFLDLSLPDSSGTDSFINLDKLLPHVPIIVLSGLADMDVALKTIALGAQDYLMKGEFDEKLLAKAIQYGLERKKILEKLQESNERFEIVNKATLDVIWDWNPVTNELYMSNSCEHILGQAPQNMTRDWFLERVHPDDRGEIRQSFMEALQKRRKNWNSEYRLRALDGSYKNIFSKGHISYNAEGQPCRIIGAATDITEKRKLEKELLAQQINQQKLITETAILAQEKERNELAKELHDNINQILATIKMFLNIAKEDERMREELVNRSHDTVSYAIEEIRKLSQSLVAPSLGDIGIEEALQELTAQINSTKGIEVILNYENPMGKKLDATIELMLYRIVQEQINNIIKHAQATNAVITLKVDCKNIFLSIADNGVGFDSSKRAKGIGLKNISNRVAFYSGNLNIITAPGKGCRLEINIPV